MREVFLGASGEAMVRREAADQGVTMVSHLVATGAPNLFGGGSVSVVSRRPSYDRPLVVVRVRFCLVSSVGHSEFRFWLVEIRDFRING